jgi:hypothetical protein
MPSGRVVVKREDHTTDGWLRELRAFVTMVRQPGSGLV